MKTKIKFKKLQVVTYNCHKARRNSDPKTVHMLKKPSAKNANLNPVKIELNK